MKPLLIVISGPTAVGKTNLSIQLAKRYKTMVLSADSRQFFRELQIGTARPTEEEMQGVQHFFVANKSIAEDYNVAQFEGDAIECLDKLFQRRKIVIMCGGSGLFIDAVCNGMDSGLPKADKKIRAELNDLYEKAGIDALREKLKKLDEDFYAKVDLKNPRRLIRALEVCLQTGKTYSSFRKGKRQERHFETKKIALNLPREILYDRINRRVDEMMKAGLEAEARSVYKYKNALALQTFGYKELFEYFEDKITLEDAVEQIKKNTRHYAKRQLTWLRRDGNYHWFEPDEVEKIISFVEENN